MNKIMMTLSLLFYSASCAPSQDDKGALIPYTQIHIVELMFAEDLPEHYFIGQYDGYRLCRDTDIRNGWKNSFVGLVLATESMSLGVPETCQITFLKKRRDNRRYDFNVKKHGCDYYFQMSDDVVRRMDIIIDSDDITVFRKCLFRTGLFSMGFNGALDIEDERLFVPRSKSFWAVYSKGPEYVTLVQFFLAQCDFKMQKFASRQDVIEASQNMKCKKFK